jgi:hypothetical protein
MNVWMVTVGADTCATTQKGRLSVAVTLATHSMLQTPRLVLVSTNIQYRVVQIVLTVLWLDRCEWRCKSHYCLVGVNIRSDIFCALMTAIMTKTAMMTIPLENVSWVLHDCSRLCWNNGMLNLTFFFVLYQMLTNVMWTTVAVHTTVPTLLDLIYAHVALATLSTLLTSPATVRVTAFAVAVSCMVL